MTEAQWVQFAAHGFKRKRAELACAFCHSKKIRCDLQVKRNEGQDSCTNCSTAERDCCTRPSRRDKRHRNSGNPPSHPPSHPPTPPTDNPDNDTLSPSSREPNPFSSSIDYNAQPAEPSRSARQYSGARSSFVAIQSAQPSTTQWTAFNNPQVTGALEEESSRHNENSDITALATFEPEDAGILPSSTRQETTDGRIFDANIFHVNQLENTDKNINNEQRREERNTSVEFEVSQGDLRQSYIETYWEYCYPWCPVLLRDTILQELMDSSLLDDALATGASHLRPPLIPHPGPAAYYERARRTFYDDGEEDLVKSLKAVLLFYWWAPRPPLMVHKHSSWWWTAVVIKHAQQAGFHFQSAAELSEVYSIQKCIKRRIWWTAFARERLTALCQGKPCLIDSEDCNIPEPSIDDFPELEDKTKAEVFVYWVRLCAIIGRVAKELLRSTNSNSNTSPFPVHLARELIEWIRSLPPHLQLRIGSNHTTAFQLDIHQLHLPYLAVIVVLHLARSPQSLPRALPPAIMAATCIARILKDVLLRSATGYMMPITCWYTAMAFICLLQALRTDHLKDGAKAEIEILLLTVKELQKKWATATVIRQQFERLLKRNKPLTPEDFPNSHLGNNRSTRALHSEEDVLMSGIDWLDYFPFVTSQTSAVAEQLMVPTGSNEIFWDEASIFLCTDFLQGLDDWASCSDFI